MKCQEEHYMTNRLWCNYVCTFRCNATGGWINFSGNIFTFLPLFLMIEWEEFGVDRIPYATMFSQEWHVGWGYGEIVLGAKYK